MFPKNGSATTSRAASDRWLTGILDRPRSALFAILVAHVAFWTLSPALTHTGLPTDLVEGYALSKEWLVATFKHPALPYWLLELSRMLTGAVGWPAYLMSALCAAGTMAIIYGLGRDMTDAKGAASAALLLSGVIYFNWVIPEFNHNVAQMPAWAAVILCLWRARTRATIFWWLAVGITAAIGMNIKLSTAFLLIVAAAYICLDRRCRIQIATPGPWLGALAFTLLMLPLCFALTGSDFQMLDYAESRALKKSDGIARFLGKQLLSVGVLGLLALIALLPLRRVATHSARSAPPTAGGDGALTFILVMHFAPLALLLAGAMIRDIGLKGSWGTAMTSLNGLGVVMLASHFGWDLRFRRIAIGAAVLTVLVPAAYATSVLVQDRYTKAPQRVNWPQREIAGRMQAIWRQETGKPLAFVAGDFGLAGQIAAFAADRPSLMVEGGRERSPWISTERLARDGALVVWLRWIVDPPASVLPIIGDHPRKSEVFRIDFARTPAGQITNAVEVFYVVVPPAPHIAR